MLMVNSLHRAGSERNVVAICRHIDRARYQPEVWTLTEGGAYEAIMRDAGVPIHCLHRTRAYGPMFAARAARRIAGSGADIMHAFSPAIMFYAALSRAWLAAKQPLVFTEATSVPRPWMRFLHRYRLRHCSAFTANSEASRANLASQGVPVERIRLIHNGHELDQFRKPLDSAAIRASLGIRSEECLALFVGRLIDSKRVCDLIDAVGQVNGANRGLRVVIAGDGAKRAELEAQTSAAGLNGIVQFVGSRGDVIDLLRSSDLFVFPSEVEGLSNAVIEAALAGLPIVGCDVGGVRDVVENGREALLVSPRNPRDFALAMQRMLDNPTEARQFGGAARTRAERSFSIDNTLQELYGLYDTILSAKS